MSMRKTTMLEWNVYVSNFNDRRIEKHNVFNHWGVMENLKRIARKYRDREREQFEEQMRRILMHYYWSKCEWEIVLDHFPPSDRFRPEKVDVWDQISLNWQSFADYVWSHRAELRRREKKDAIE